MNIQKWNIGLANDAVTNAVSLNLTASNAITDVAYYTVADAAVTANPLANYMITNDTTPCVSGLNYKLTSYAINLDNSITINDSFYSDQITNSFWIAYYEIVTSLVLVIDVNDTDWD